VSRLISGVLPPGVPEEESHASGLLEYPHYTRPADFRGWTVPDVLLSGNHAEIAKWRRQQAERKTLERGND
jgi:tRNA (guanine37-N1)-methyltransferase